MALKVVTPRTAPSAGSTVSDLTRKQQVGDLITHLARSDNHTFQAIKGLQDQNNQLVSNMMDVISAIHTLAANTSQAISNATGVPTTVPPPTTPGSGGSSGGSGSASQGGTGGSTQTTPPPSNPPALPSGPSGFVADFNIQNQTVTQQPNGTWNADADFNWNVFDIRNTPSQLYYAGVTLFVTASTVPSISVGQSIGGFGGPIGASDGQGCHVTLTNLPTGGGGTLQIAAVTMNTAGQPNPNDTGPLWPNSQQVSWTISI